MNIKKGLFISLLMTFTSLVISLYFAFTIKQQIPIHWNAAGEIDGYGSPYTLLLFPAISLALCLLLYFLPRLDPKGENIEKSGPLLPILMIFMSLLFLVIETITVCVVFGIMAFNMSIVIMLLISVMFVVIGFYMPKVKQNYTMGIRTPWTLASEKVWEKTHRAGGKWFIASGVMFAIGLLLPPPLNFFIPVSFVLAVTVGVTVYSYILFNNERKKGQ